MIGVCNMEFIGDLDGMGLLEDVPGRIRRDFIHEGVREETLGSAIQSGVSGGSSIWGGGQQYRSLGSTPDPLHPMCL